MHSPHRYSSGPSENIQSSGSNFSPQFVHLIVLHLPILCHPFVRRSWDNTVFQYTIFVFVPHPLPLRISFRNVYSDDPPTLPPPLEQCPAQVRLARLRASQIPLAIHHLQIGGQTEQDAFFSEVLAC
jgi:hypothetical protein